MKKLFLILVSFLLLNGCQAADDFMDGVNTLFIDEEAEYVAPVIDPLLELNRIEHRVNEVENASLELTADFIAVLNDEVLFEKLYSLAIVSTNTGRISFSRLTIFADNDFNWESLGFIYNRYSELSDQVLNLLAIEIPNHVNANLAFYDDYCGFEKTFTSECPPGQLQMRLADIQIDFMADLERYFNEILVEQDYWCESAR